MRFRTFTSFAAAALFLLGWGEGSGSARAWGQMAVAPQPPAPSMLAQAMDDAERLPAPPVPQGDARFSARYDVAHGQPLHRVALLDDGVASLEARLWMIQHAQSEIDLSYYIFESDHAGRILLQALLAKKAEMARAGRPLRVRMILDRQILSDPGVNRYTIQELNRAGIEVKFYNPTLSDTRTHQKILLVDGKHFITGGRNIQDAYFGLDPKYNYLDTDIYVQGPAAGSVQGSYNAFWDSGVSRYPATPSPNAAQTRAAQALLTPSPELDNMRARIDAKGTRELNELYVFPAASVTALSDKPMDQPNSRQASAWLLHELGTAQQRVLMENWTFIPDDRPEVFKQLLQRGVSVELMTNTFHSRDNGLVFLSYPRQVEMVRQGMKIMGYSGKPTDDPGLDAETSGKAVWGTHSKSACIDDRECFVGTVNLDPRSDQRNAENGIIVNDNPAFATAVESGIMRRIRDSRQLGRWGRYTNTIGNQMATQCRRFVNPSSDDISRVEGFMRLGEELLNLRPGTM